MSVFNLLNEVIHVYTCTHKMFEQCACNLICLKFPGSGRIFLAIFSLNSKPQQKVSKN